MTIPIIINIEDYFKGVTMVNCKKQGQRQALGSFIKLNWATLQHMKWGALSSLCNGANLKLRFFANMLVGNAYFGVWLYVPYIFIYTLNLNSLNYIDYQPLTSSSPFSEF